MGKEGSQSSREVRRGEREGEGSSYRLAQERAHAFLALLPLSFRRPSCSPRRSRSAACELGGLEREKEKGDTSRREDDDGRSPTPDSSEKKRKRNAAHLFRTGAPILHHSSPRALNSKQLKATEAVAPKPGKRTAHVSHTPAEQSPKATRPRRKCRGTLSLIQGLAWTSPLVRIVCRCGT